MKMLSTRRPADAAFESQANVTYEMQSLTKYGASRHPFAA